MLKAPQYRRRRHVRRRLFLADQIAITYLKPDASEKIRQPHNHKHLSWQHFARMIAQGQAPACGCCGEDASTVFEAIAMIYTSGELPLCDTCWKTQGTGRRKAKGKIGWMYYRPSKKVKENDEEELTFPHE